MPHLDTTMLSRHTVEVLNGPGTPESSSIGAIEYDIRETEYDTYMPERVGIRVRRLPDGEFRDALQTSSEGRFLALDVPGEGLPLGSLLEIERGPMLYWGELLQLAGSAALVWIGHSLDRSKLHPIRETWGE